MTKQFEFMKPDNSLRQASERMKSLQVGFMPILENNEPKGLVTDRDIVVRAIAEGKDPNTTTIKDIMTENLIFATENMSLDQAADLMEDNKVRRLIVKDDKNQITGVISLGDLAVNTNNKVTGDTLTHISKPAEPNR
jgi:CBS domain-containing protein